MWWLRFGVYRPCTARHTNITLEYRGTRSRLKKKKKCNNDSFGGVSYSHFTRAVNMINVFFLLILQRAMRKNMSGNVDLWVKGN